MSVIRALRSAAAATAATVLLFALSACGGSAEAPPAGDSAGGTEAAPPVAPISSRGTPAGPAAPAAGMTGEIAWDLPASWQMVTPSSTMRLAQAVIPGDAGPGELVVFYFGPGGGGDVEANLARWVGQMELAPGTEASREAFDVGGYRVTLLEVAGTLKPSGMGMGPSEPVPGSRMLAAVVEGPGGPWFFKATGPDATLAAARDDYRAMLESVRPAG
jgi:hypothetical protein